MKELLKYIKHFTINDIVQIKSILNKLTPEEINFIKEKFIAIKGLKED